MLDWDYLRMIALRQRWIFFGLFIPVLLLTAGYLVMAPRLYESTAVVQVAQHQQRVIKSIDQDSDDDDLKSEDSIPTIEQNLQSYTLFLDVVTEPDIASDPAFLVGYHGRNDISDQVAWLQANTKVGLRRGTRLIDVSVYHRVPEMAQKLAQAIVNTFVTMNDQSQTAEQQRALELLVKESEAVKDNLQTAEDSLHFYKDALVLKDRIDTQMQVISGLEQRYREKHPQLIQARTLLTGLFKDFDNEFKRIVSNSKSEAAYWATRKEMLATVAPDDYLPTEMKLVEARAEVLQKEVDTQIALFDNVSKQMRESNIARDSAATEIQLKDAPVVPIKPAKPKKLITLFLGTALGFFLGAGGVFFAHAADNSIHTPQEAEALLGLPVVGSIPLDEPKRPVDRPKGRAASATGNAPARLVMLSDPGGAAAEGFRSLRASLGALRNIAAPRTILFSSAIPGEGKTFVSCNYALALARAGSKTLLIDTDMRRPSVQSLFGLPNKVGLMELLQEGRKLDRVVHPSVEQNLDILTTGSPCPNPAELLGSSKFGDLMAHAAVKYDQVVLDTSPVNLVRDCLLVAAHVEGVYLVVRAASTPLRAPHYALSLLHRAHKEMAGIILNALPPGHDRLYLGYKGSLDSYGKVYAQGPSPSMAGERDD